MVSPFFWSEDRKNCLQNIFKNKNARKINHDFVFNSIGFNNLTNMTQYFLSQDQQKKYDYLNKYNQHNILQKAYEEEAHRLKYPSPQKTYVQLTVDSPLTKNSIVPELRHTLSEEVNHQNVILSQQIKQYKILVISLEKQIENLRKDAILMKENSYNDKVYYQKIIHQLKEEVENTRFNSKVLNREMRAFQGLKKQNEELNQKLEDSSKQFHACFKKLKNLESAIKNCLGFEGAFISQKVVASIENEMKRRKVLEDFTACIFQINQCTDLKGLWKWLKILGNQNNYLQKIKPLLFQKTKCQTTSNIEQLLDIALIQQKN